MYEDWKQALKLEGEKNDKEDGSGVLFNIVVIGNRDTGPPQEGIKFEAMGGTKMATPQKNVSAAGSEGKPERKRVFAKRHKPRHLPPVSSQPKMSLAGRMIGPKSRPKAAKRCEAIYASFQCLLKNPRP